MGVWLLGCRRVFLRVSHGRELIARRAGEKHMRCGGELGRGGVMAAGVVLMDNGGHQRGLLASRDADGG
eukprot:6316801-Prymnesium_polylepis.2